MTWGTGSWGAGSPWGIGASAPPPTIIAVSSVEPTAPLTGGQVVARRGGDVIKIVGSNFVNPITIEVLNAGLEVVGTCYPFDDLGLFALKPNTVFCGTPALPDGLYSLRVTTVGGSSTVLEDALQYELFAEEMKTQRVRVGLMRKWKAGRRLLSTNEALI